METFYIVLYILMGALAFLLTGLTISTIVFTIRKNGIKEFSQLAKIPLIIYNLLSYIGYIVILIVGMKYNEFNFGIAFIIGSIICFVVHLLIHIYLHKKLKPTISIQTSNPAISTENEKQLYECELQDLGLILNIKKPYDDIKEWFNNNQNLLYKYNQELYCKIKDIIQIGMISKSDITKIKKILNIID